MSYQSINPATGKVLKNFKELTGSQLGKSLRLAAACYTIWRNTTFTRRAAVASKAAAILRSRVDEFARPMTLEMGKRIEEARSEVEIRADTIDYYAEKCRMLPGFAKAQAKVGSCREISLTIIRAFRRAQSDGWQCRDGETRGLRAAMSPRLRAALARGRRPPPPGAYTNLFISHDQVNEVIDDPPHHLLLGNDAYEGATAKLKALSKEFKAWESLTRGADFPKKKS
jgi:succinate-semialdehyde dehydrogenase / glutarate-semialdehyde dehydrogenase